MSDAPLPPDRSIITSSAPFVYKVIAPDDCRQDDKEGKRKAFVRKGITAEQKT